MQDKHNECEVEILDEDLNLDTHETARETEHEGDIYLGDGCWGKAEYFEH